MKDKSLLFCAGRRYSCFSSNNRNSPADMSAVTRASATGMFSASPPRGLDYRFPVQQSLMQASNQKDKIHIRAFVVRIHGAADI